MENIFIIIFGVLLALFCLIGIWVYITNVRTLRARKFDDVAIVKPDGKLGYAYTDDKLYEGVVVINNGSESFIRTTDDTLYVLRREALPVGQKVVIAVRNRPSAMDKYLKPMVLPKVAVDKESNIKARLLCRVNKDIVLCRITKQQDDLFGSIKREYFLVNATIEEQERYSSKTNEDDGPRIPFVDCFEYEEETPCMIPVKYIGDKWSIPACLQRSSKTKIKGKNNLLNN